MLELLLDDMQEHPRSELLQMDSNVADAKGRGKAASVKAPSMSTSSIKTSNSASSYKYSKSAKSGKSMKLSPALHSFYIGAGYANAYSYSMRTRSQTAYITIIGSSRYGYHRPYYYTRSPSSSQQDPPAPDQDSKVAMLAVNASMGADQVCLLLPAPRW